MQFNPVIICVCHIISSCCKIFFRASPWHEGPWVLRFEFWGICMSLCTSRWSTISCVKFCVLFHGTALYHVHVYAWLCAHACVISVCCNQNQILKIREFTFHQVNANLLWPGTRIFAEWLVKHPTLLPGRRILELGRWFSDTFWVHHLWAAFFISVTWLLCRHLEMFLAYKLQMLWFFSGTGALTIFLRKMYDLDITTSDYDDEDIEKNIHHNHVANDVPFSPHIRRKRYSHTFETVQPSVQKIYQKLMHDHDKIIWIFISLDIVIMAMRDKRVNNRFLIIVKDLASSWGSQNF